MKCIKCGSRDLRLRSISKSHHQNICNACNKKVADAWWKKNQVYKCCYADAYKLGLRLRKLDHKTRKIVKQQLATGIKESPEMKLKTKHIDKIKPLNKQCKKTRAIILRELKNEISSMPSIKLKKLFGVE